MLAICLADKHNFKVVFLDACRHKTLWENLEETEPPDWEEFASLFSRQVQEKKATARTKAAQAKAKEVRPPWRRLLFAPFRVLS